MHIPDGYLSPSTCAVLYAAAVPFWYVALRRVKRLLQTRLVPLISVFAAFSFVIMMFNLPLPGGTTGHAVGLGLASVVLGPWAAMLSISVALLIQALLFGDGGILAFGANGFNMGVVGTLVASGVYRLIAGRAALDSSRRVVAAGLAGYMAINVAALCAGLEFGLQPLWFKDAAGAPLYAPYPLHIAVPAMMIGHLTFAGLAELIVSAGVVAYLQRANPELLSLTNPASALLQTNKVSMSSPPRGTWHATKRLWIGLAALMLLTPLGLVAAGTAWGEWSLQDYADPVARQQIAAASSNQAPPAQPPAGMAHLAALWTAPLPDYAPPFMHNPRFGYIMSAITGSGLIVLICLLASRLINLRVHRSKTIAAANPSTGTEQA